MRPCGTSGSVSNNDIYDLPAGPVGRPPGLKDGPCLLRLAEMGLACQRLDGRFEATGLGAERHPELVGAR